MPVINRQAHRLRAVTTMAMPRHVICFDTETHIDKWNDGDYHITEKGRVALCDARKKGW